MSKVQCRDVGMSRVLEAAPDLFCERDVCDIFVSPQANPPQLDFVEDLAQLRHLNESGLVHALRSRFASGLVHCYAGAGLVLFNPLRPLAIYSDKVMRLFRECKADDLPPHVFAVSQAAHTALVSTRRDQTVLLLGRSGAGKTSAARQLLQYLAITTSPTPAQGNVLAGECASSSAAKT